MKATEVLRRYTAGERDFKRVNLRGQSFQGQDLSGADFSEADIRGTNFKDAILRGTKFCGAKAGLQTQWAIFLVLLLWVISVCSGFFWGIFGGFVAYIFDGSDPENQALGWGVLIGLIVLFGLLIRYGLGTNVAVAFAFAVAVAVAFAVAVAVAGILISAYLGWRALKGDPRDAFIRSLAVAVAATGGTTFYNADLTDADFTKATLKGTDLRAKSLIRTCFKDTIKLSQAIYGKTLLADSAVRQLLITGYGYKKSYIDANLRGVYLAGANLNEANLKLADLGDATLQDANLEGANLTEINAIGTDFTRASLTGACIEAWNIENSTRLNEIDCRYIYLLEHPKRGTDDRERRPSSGDFQPGDFTKLFEEVIDTIDFIFRNGIDWKAFVSAFQQVQVENEDTPLTIQSMENKGDGVVVVKVSVPPDTDKEKIHQEFTQNYDLALKAIEDKYKAQLEAKEENIILYKQSLEDYRQRDSEMMTIIKTLANNSGNRIELNTGTKITTDQSQSITTGQDLSINAEDSLVNLRDINP